MRGTIFVWRQLDQASTAVDSDAVAYSEACQLEMIFVESGMEIKYGRRVGETKRDMDD